MGDIHHLGFADIDEARENVNKPDEEIQQEVVVNVEENNENKEEKPEKEFDASAQDEDIKSDDQVDNQKELLDENDNMEANNQEADNQEDSLV